MADDGSKDHIMRVGDRGWWVQITGHAWQEFGAGHPEEGWSWNDSGLLGQVIILALGLTGNETAEQLHALAGLPSPKHPLAEVSDVEVLVAELTTARKRIAELEAEVAHLAQ